jgi:PAS domain S-box-containing protein
LPGELPLIDMRVDCSDGDSHVLWQDGERVVRKGWRPGDDGQQRGVLIVLPATDHPSRSSLDRLTHEYALKDELDGAWAALPLDLVRDAGRTMLVLEDAGGEPLDRLLGAPIEMGRFLRLAIDIAVALGKLHQRGLVHKDIKPPNILVNGATGVVRLTGFGIASRLARERQSPHPPETIAGTLAYMAPEQTGRMNRSIDSRSDLYALGVTFYQMLTDALPFTAADPMEWVHCHLAKQPLAPVERLKEIPGAVSAIVMKLLAKRAEDRYQTAGGLERDLRRCPAEWEAQRRPLEAMDLYERAVASARANGFVHNEALAYELAARFYAARGFNEVAHLYLGNARRAYLRWGADGKVRQLDQLHPWLRQDERAPGPTGTIELPVEHLDLATMIGASQALSGEIVLEKLIDRLLRAAVEHAGAERGLLIVPRGDLLQIEAVAFASDEQVTVHLRGSPDAAVSFPESLVRYGTRTRERLILNDSSSQNAFSADPYIVRSHPRSILCLPLISQHKLIGILYLENNLAPNVFTPDRVTLLEVLASQAAISLENSRLYHDLADREGKIRRLVDANIIGIFIADRESRILEANDAFLRIVGYDREDLVLGRMRWTELSPPEWRERDQLTRAQLHSTGIVQPFEKEYFRKDGSRVPVLVGVASFKEGSDEGLAFVLDLTERKRAEQALRESERSLRSAIDGIPGLVGMLAPNGEVEAVNRQILEYSGRSLEELKDWGTNGTVHPEDLPHYVEVVMKSIAAGVPFETEARLRRFDGEYRWFDIRCVPIRDDSGRITRWYFLTTDIEDRTQTLARLQQMQSDFAHINRVSMMGELTASLAHEVLHPIATARNNARAGMRFLEKIPPNLDEVREALRCVVRDVDRAKDIVGRIRDHVKKAPPRRERFDLNEAASEVIAMVRSAIANARVTVHTHLVDGPVPVQGDRVQLQQVVENLILNAVDAMSSVAKGARELSIRIERDPASGGVLVEVGDSGPGIDPANHEQVFEPFYTTKASGVGLGLSICRSIIGGHGGHLWVSANEPRGAVFRLTLPAAQEGS